MNYKAKPRIHSSMKQIVATVLMILFGVNPLIGQSLEIGLYTGIGISDSNFASTIERIQNENHYNFLPIELGLNYRINKLKTINPFIGTGIKLTKNKFYQNVQSLEFGYNVKQVYFSHWHLGIPIRIGVDKKLFGQNSFGIHYELQYNLALVEEEDLSGDGVAVSGSLSYNYSLKNRVKSFLSNTFTLYLRTRITTNLFLTSSVGYGLVPTTGDYDFLTNQTQTFTDQATGDQYQVQSSYAFEDEQISNNLLVFKIGITREF